MGLDFCKLLKRFERNVKGFCERETGRRWFEGIARAGAALTQDLAVSQGRLGSVLMARGDGQGALAEYRKSQGICEALAALDEGDGDCRGAGGARSGECFVADGFGAFVLEAGWG